MAASSEQQVAPATTTATSQAQPDDITKMGPTSPSQSEKSSDSEGRPVREKLKETRIDAQAASDRKSYSDQPMKDVPNGTANAGELSSSGSDSDRGRLRRKRSREDFEDDHEAEKQPEKKQEKEKEGRHHRRKRSRDVKDIESGLPLKPLAASVERIEENDGDEQMTTPNKHTAKAVLSGKDSETDTSPKNKRTRDQVEEDTAATREPVPNAVANGKPVSKSDDERNSKRPRDKAEDQPATKVAAKATTKIPSGSGFSNTSAASPFASMASKPSAFKAADKPQQLPQTSDDKFKASGFGGFSQSAASPFGGLAGSGTASPFATPTSTKLSSFAGSTATSTAPTSGFGALANSNKSTFGSSTFGGSLGGGFGALNGAKSSLSSFETPSDLTIKGLKSKPTAFGTPGEADRAEGSDDEDGDDDDSDKGSEERQSSQPLLSQQPHETGEEGETTVWTGRAKLYVMVGEVSARAWKERGVGTFKFNITDNEPKKARFVLRADGTHRLLLNAAVTKQLVFGGDSNGEKPKDGRLLFNSANAEGELEMHLLRLKSERAVELWEEVNKIQESEL
ncbi:hypothetical protein GQ44DRAFT_500896 [Phaeosphaeriaceae sp. PMI808]|nr:hypothetical protein GQ44DRAFT_500896 [Phaeosphaeriaceae sp. PMI808]